MLPHVQDAIRELEEKKLKMCVCIPKMKVLQKQVKSHCYFSMMMIIEANENVLPIINVKNGLVHKVNKSP